MESSSSSSHRCAWTHPSSDRVLPAGCALRRSIRGSDIRALEDSDARVPGVRHRRSRDRSCDPCATGDGTICSRGAGAVVGVAQSGHLRPNRNDADVAQAVSGRSAQTHINVPSEGDPAASSWTLSPIRTALPSLRISPVSTFPRCWTLPRTDLCPLATSRHCWASPWMQFTSTFDTSGGGVLTTRATSATSSDGGRVCTAPRVPDAPPTPSARSFSRPLPRTGPTRATFSATGPGRARRVPEPTPT